MAEREYPWTSEAWQTTQRLAPVGSSACRKGVWVSCLGAVSLADCPRPKETPARTIRVTKSHEQAFFLALMIEHPGTTSDFTLYTQGRRDFYASEPPGPA